MAKLGGPTGEKEESEEKSGRGLGEREERRDVQG